MKRIVSILLCLFLIGTLALSATAAGTAHMSISSSSGTVYRGDSFTLTVSLSNDQPVSNGAIILSYDSSVFELVGGTCNVSNATLAEVSPANGGGVFLLQSDAVVSGTIFTINMKVKSNAAFGTYTISGTPSLSIDCSLSGTSVTVGCKHSLGKASKVDDSNHESTCSICGATEKAAHTWNEGTVTKEATCKATGIKTRKCTACAAEKTETIEVNNNHEYDGWISNGSDEHYRKCNVCGNEEITEHDWYSYEILEEATCQKTGLQSVICDDCGATDEHTIGMTDHNYGAPINVTETEHTHKCADCGTVSTEEHTFGDELEHDKQMHYYACENCGYKKDQAEHVPGPAATEETDQVCTVCDRILRPKGAHVHEFVKEWSSDEINHWHDCVDCPAQDTEMPHVFDGDCDADCNTCGYTRKVSHILSPVMESDATGHWYPCVVCGEKQEFTAHNPGPAATVSSNQTCTVCKFEIAPIVPHDHVYDTYGTIHFHKCVCGLEYESDAETCGICAAAHKTFPWWIVCIVEAVVLGGVIIFLLLTRKKEDPDDEDEDEAEDEDEELSEEANKLINQLLAEEKPSASEKKDQ